MHCRIEFFGLELMITICKHLNKLAVRRAASLHLKSPKRAYFDAVDPSIVFSMSSRFGKRAILGCTIRCSDFVPFCVGAHSSSVFPNLD